MIKLNRGELNMIKEISKLNNNIEYIYKKNENTPRMAVCLNFSVNEAEKKPGRYTIMIFQ